MLGMIPRQLDVTAYISRDFVRHHHLGQAFLTTRKFNELDLLN